MNVDIISSKKVEIYMALLFNNSRQNRAEKFTIIDNLKKITKHSTSCLVIMNLTIQFTIVVDTQIVIERTCVIR